MHILLSSRFPCLFVFESGVRYSSRSASDALHTLPDLLLLCCLVTRHLFSLACLYLLMRDSALRFDYYLPTSYRIIYFTRLFFGLDS